MKIKEVHLDKYKRFSNLTISNIPATAKLVVLIGPNGCGKSSLFDSFKTWHLINGYSNTLSDDYCKKDVDDKRRGYDLVKLMFHEDINEYTQDQKKEFFYFRTAYRNSPRISVKALHTLESPILKVNGGAMIDNDATVDDNYQRLIAATISEFYNKKNNGKSVEILRDELIGKIREPLKRLFPELLLTEIGVVTEKAEFYFEKGTTKRYGYEKLSGGEKAAFDLLLDFIIKNQYYMNTVYCIDEPETHIHTNLQAKLLDELFTLISDNSQLWIATHSFGMMKEAKALSEKYPGKVVFLDFDGYDFDEPVILEPSTCTSTLWKKMIEITLDDYAPFLSPKNIVFCEGTQVGRKRKDFDARCYTNIFSTTYPDTLFYSLGGCEEFEKEKVTLFVSAISSQSHIIKLIDRDDRSDDEIRELQTVGMTVLSRRHIESYLLDDEVLIKWCKTVGKPEKATELLLIKQKAIEGSIARGNANDDIKSASNDICTKGKKALEITACGNNGEMIMRDTLSKLITPDMNVYKELERDIFAI